MRVFLNVVVELEGEEDEVVAQAKEILKATQDRLPDHSKATLTRENDRSGGNLLVPPVEGRMGTHKVAKKILIKDILV